MSLTEKILGLCESDKINYNIGGDDVASVKDV